MTAITNKLHNYSNKNVWCAYSAPKQAGEKWDTWRVRLLHADTVSSWKIDIDYVKAQDEGTTINGRPGWWKLGTAGKFFVANDVDSSTNLILRSTGGLVSSVRYYEDWAAGKDRHWYESSTPESPEEIAAYLAEWEKAKDASAPLE